jgi:hypothetical protein
MAWTTPKTWSTNEVVTAANMNTHVRDNVAFLGAPPTCSAFNSVAQSLTSGVAAVMTADSENFDTDTMHSTSSNTSRITATTAGRYLFFTTVVFAPNNIGQRSVDFRFNGSTVTTMMTVDTTGALSCILTAVKTYVLTVGQFVEVQAFQNSGGALNATLQEFGALLMTVT